MYTRAHTNRGVQQRTLLRRVLRRVLETAFEKLLRRVLRDLEGVLQWALLGRRVLRRGSKKGLSRRHLEGRSTPFREYDPLGVCPIHASQIQMPDSRNGQPTPVNECEEPSACSRNLAPIPDGGNSALVTGF